MAANPVDMETLLMLSTWLFGGKIIDVLQLSCLRKILHAAPIM